MKTVQGEYSGKISRIKIQQPLKTGGSIEATKRRLGIDSNGEVTNNRDERLRGNEECCMIIQQRRQTLGLIQKGNLIIKGAFINEEKVHEGNSK